MNYVNSETALTLIYYIIDFNIKSKKCIRQRKTLPIIWGEIHCHNPRLVPNLSKHLYNCPTRRQLNNLVTAQSIFLVKVKISLRKSIKISMTNILMFYSLCGGAQNSKTIKSQETKYCAQPYTSIYVEILFWGPQRLTVPKIINVKIDLECFIL